MDSLCEDNIEKLYKNYDILSDAKDKISEVCFFYFYVLCGCCATVRTTECGVCSNYCSPPPFPNICLNFNHGNLASHFQHEKEYREILDAIKGSPKEKRLASQFIGKFFKFFPKLSDVAIDAQLDLCEDEDIQVNLFFILDSRRIYILCTLDSSPSNQRFAATLQRF